MAILLIVIAITIASGDSQRFIFSLLREFSIVRSPYSFSIITPHSLRPDFSTPSIFILIGNAALPATARTWAYRIFLFSAITGIYISLSLLLMIASRFTHACWWRYGTALSLYRDGFWSLSWSQHCSAFFSMSFKISMNAPLLLTFHFRLLSLFPQLYFSSTYFRWPFSLPRITFPQSPPISRGFTSKRRFIEFFTLPAINSDAHWYFGHLLHFTAAFSRPPNFFDYWELLRYLIFRF